MNTTIITRTGKRVQVVTAPLNDRRTEWAATVIIDKRVAWADRGWSSRLDCKLDALAKRRELVGE